MLNNSLAYDKAYQLAIRIVQLYQYLNRDHHEYIMAKQILRCGTSIGANLAEANGAISRADFSAKISIAYKETLETKYWLSLLKDTLFLNPALYASLFNDTDEIAKILFAILRKTRINC